MSVSYDLGRITGGFIILGYYASLEALELAITTPSNGDAYGVGIAAPYTIYVWDGVTNSWLDNGTLKGEKGDKGDTGYPGATGATGAAGADGADGAAATIAVGTVTTGAAGSSVSVTNSGTTSAAVFDFAIPQGSKGDTGETGAKGDKGDTGTAATITVGTVTTSAPGSDAVVTNVGTSGTAVFDFTLPQGDASTATAAAEAAALSASTAEGAATAAAESAATAVSSIQTAIQSAILDSWEAVY